MENIKEKKKKKKDNLLFTWMFRISSVFIIIFVCYLIIKAEFKSLKENEFSRESTLHMLRSIENSSENIQNAWNKIYYFYQTGDLMNIIKCPSAVSKEQNKNNDLLLNIYRENIITTQSINSKNMLENYNNMKNIRCGGRITINIGLKKEIYKHPKNFETYTFKLGEEPIDMIKNYPFVKNALSKIREGERMTFIAMPKEKNDLIVKKQFIYEIEVPEIATNETARIPFYSILQKTDNKFLVDKQIACGNVVHYSYTIYNIDGEKIKTSSNLFDKVKIGSGGLNSRIEQLILQMSVGDSFIVFLPKNIIEQNSIFTKDILKNNVVLFEMKILNVQK